MVNCPKCNTENQDDAMNCKFCHINLAFAFSHPEEIGLKKILQSLPSDSAFNKSLPQTTLASKELGKIILSVVVTRPVYFFSWIALIGLIILRIRIIEWLFRPPFSLQLFIHILCGIITADIAKRRGKSPLLWFIIGLIPIGFLFMLASHTLCIIIFALLSGGEL